MTETKFYARSIEGVRYVTLGQVCAKVKRDRRVVVFWYDWWEEWLSEEERAAYPYPLPPYRRDLDARHDRYWRESDIPALIKFRDAIRHNQFHAYRVQLRAAKGGS